MGDSEHGEWGRVKRVSEKNPMAYFLAFPVGGSLTFAPCRKPTMEQSLNGHKEPPHSEEMEKALLSCIFLDGGEEVLLRAIDAKISEKSFYFPAHGLVWKVALWLHKKGLKIDLLVAAEELKKIGKLEQVGGVAGLAQATSSQPTSALAGTFIEKIQELYMLRELIKAGARIQEESYAYEGDVSKFVQVVEDCLALREGLEKQMTFAEACDEAVKRIERLAKGEKLAEDVGMDWPWLDANKFLGPIQNGELVVLAARPGRGKSSVARQLALYWAERYGPVDLFSREMPVGQLPFLFAQSVCKHSWRSARRGELHPTDLVEFADCLKELKKLKNLRIHDRDKSFSQVLARIRATVQMAKPKAIIIDYLQIYDVEQQKSETRDIAIGRITKGLKDLAIDLNIPVILLAQISRSVEKEEREPRCSDLRESGNIEADADRVIFVHWNSKRDDGMEQDFNDHDIKIVQTKLIQAKGRGEGAACLSLEFYRPIATFFQS